MRGFLAHLRATGAPPREVLVGRDLRPSSPRIAAACRRAVRAEGMTAVGCGVVPTPALALEAARRGAAAVMVTGSHIPFDRNGLEVLPAGRRGDRQGRRGGDPRRAGRAGAGAGAAGPGSIRAWARATWRGRWRSSAKGVSRGFGSGSTSTAPPGATRCAGRSPRSGRRWSGSGGATSFVPIDTEAVPRAEAERIRGWVAEHRLAALVSTDGDGDRPLVADEAGRVLRGDALGALAARLARGGRGGGAVERQHGAGGLGLVRAGRCARGSARRTSSQGWRG